MITAICNDCGKVFKAMVILGIVRCPACGSVNVSAGISEEILVLDRNTMEEKK
jgi:predicted Zn-ribbon and HTH transcriptional regulator